LRLNNNKREKNYYKKQKSKGLYNKHRHIRKNSPLGTAQSSCRVTHRHQQPWHLVRPFRSLQEDCDFWVEVLRVWARW